MPTDYKWLFCESDLAGIMLLVLDNKEVHSKELLRVSNGYDRIKKKASMLADAGLLSVFEVEKPHPATTYMLTDKGKEVAFLLKRIKSVLDGDREQNTLDEYCQTCDDSRPDRKLLKRGINRVVDSLVV
ncbi:MAG: hypothetical protein J6O90_03885 [Candidatus Methanomethylophilaceae archaeon]|nr:hypothetical protein [Candidatus Methanomethylophilaceae archaeon]